MAKSQSYDFEMKEAGQAQSDRAMLQTQANSGRRSGNPFRSVSHRAPMLSTLGGREEVFRDAIEHLNSTRFMQ
jgi:hypothetical protein